ncbi:hypothetical protein KY290_008188 [Solanum tuberosum]|uniref:Uncharacterized protein n=1 Tax=Solanum tuberosum TaxID=4113 RepID=A0ABQ7WAE1_SOLTU|nr:hypothetical protein KY290_008188 [Solanum tuberosum]
MTVLLRKEDLIHVIDGKYLDKTSDSNKENIEGDALNVIQLSLAPNVLCEVSTSTEETAKLIWKRLEGLYHNRSVTTRMLLQRRLHTFKMDSGVKRASQKPKTGPWDPLQSPRRPMTGTMDHFGVPEHVPELSQKGSPPMNP